MDYISTRGKAPKLKFDDVFLSGLASDGGLYVPSSYPQFSASEISEFQNFSYKEIAFKVIKPFVSDSIPDDILSDIIEKSYNAQVFNHTSVAPLIQIDHQNWILELFHGPTLAFKDFALQFVGHLLEYLLTKKQEKAIILGATSGDTGSAAIHGCKNCHQADIFILHPHNKVSDVQRKQMTTIDQDNVYNIAIDGNFDDCQAIVKHIFCNQEFVKGKRLIAVNSINWARIVGQIVYYFYSATRIGAPARKISFSVPTGNFGDIFAGYVAFKMGLPVDKLIIATNKNDILDRFIKNNAYDRKTLYHSLSPSMDIQISSNFERLLFNAHGNDDNIISDLMEKFQNSGKLSVNDNIHREITQMFLSSSSNDEEICDTIIDIKNSCDMVIDPHTATGIKAAKEFSSKINSPIITLATAHPAKFEAALNKAKVKLNNVPNNLENSIKGDEKFDTLNNSIEKIVEFIKEKSL